MRTITFAVSKGGVGKSLLTANVSAAMAKRGHKVAMVEGDPNKPLLEMLRMTSDIKKKKVGLKDVVERNLPVSDALYETHLRNLYLIPSEISLEGYFGLSATRFAEKLSNVQVDYLFVDVPFPLGEAALLSMGFSQYVIPIIIEESFAPGMRAVIESVYMGKHALKCTPLGYIINRIKTPTRFNDEFVRDLSELFGIECIAKIMEEPYVSLSYGGAKTTEAYVAYLERPNTDFANSIDKIANAIVNAPPSEKTDPVAFLKSKLEVVL
jgi:septum site-determining protein MinD